MHLNLINHNILSLKGISDLLLVKKIHYMKSEFQKVYFMENLKLQYLCL